MNAFLLQQTWLIITQNEASPYWLIGGGEMFLEVQCGMAQLIVALPLAVLSMRHPCILSLH
jgi:hypothetical protein